jgi:hypothetical protein
LQEEEEEEEEEKNESWKVEETTEARNNYKKLNLISKIWRS